MNKTAIKNFAIWARNKLIADISYKAGLLGITENGIKSPLPQSTQTVQFFDIGTKEPSSVIGVEIQQRKRLVEEIERKAKQSDYTTAYKNVIEEVAYTWFNRLIAIRFMEVNDYLPTRIRVLSSENDGKAEPDLVTHALEANLDYSAYEKDRIIQLKLDNKLDELFRMLFIKQCNALNINLPELFEKTNDYTELLLNVSFTDKEGVIYHLVNDIDEDDFNVSKEGQVEIIGWLYQYYNEERKNEVINIYKGTIKKDDIPAATQLFTTDWVVRYMVDNSLGRYWLERNPSSHLAEKLKFLVKPKTGEIKTVKEKTNPQEMTIFDPCMGSGHILVYAFDVLMEIYKEIGYAERDAAQLIVQNNLFGLDIDNRAYQLAYFAIMMKARSYDRRFLTRNITPNISAIIETNGLPNSVLKGITADSQLNIIGEYLIDAYKDAKEIGSLNTIQILEYEVFLEFLEDCTQEGQLSIESSYWFNTIKPIMIHVAKQAAIMSKKYTVVCTNPPYMNKLDGQLKKFVVQEYKPFGGDLFSSFMRRNFDYCSTDGYLAFMTPFVWMFIKTYEYLREFIVKTKAITSLIQMEYSAFEEATVPICTFVLRNGIEKEPGLYIKLSDFKGGMDVQKTMTLEAINNKESNYYFETSVKELQKIPSFPISYWANHLIYEIFNNNPTISDYFTVRNGITTGENERFIRYWFEIDFSNKNKWRPCNKGGSYRKWSGNREFVIDWENDGERLKNFKDLNGKNRATLRSIEYNFQEAITMSRITSSKNSYRWLDKGFITEGASNNIYFKYEYKNQAKVLLAILNSKVGEYLLSLYNQTINVMPDEIRKFPLVLGGIQEEIIRITDENIDISQNDWNLNETSWDFVKNPLISHNINDNNLYKSSFKVRDCLQQLNDDLESAFIKVKENEIRLNELILKMYGMQNDFSSEVSDEDISVSRIDNQRQIKSLISYSVGCMFGRYSLIQDQLIYPGEKWDFNNYKYCIPDIDNIIPFSDEEYFQDDIVSRLVEFLRVVYGTDTLEENLDFIANLLGIKGNSSREIIRNYFLKDFFKDHCQVYQKRPIYWLFDSGKQNGFKALVYMHRYDENTIGNLRIDYLHRMQRIYENEIAGMQDTIENSRDAREVTTATKRKEKLIKQLQETKEYDEKIAHLALARTSIDLDDGVKVNYEKVQTDRDGKKLDVLAKI